MRTDGRMLDEVRPLSIERNYTCFAAGSVLMRMGQTHVLCTAMIEDKVPRHCLEKRMGWVTAEYRMLPSAGPQRHSLHGPIGGRDYEISRLIGRALRAAVDLHPLAGRTIWIDCNVIQADGGTRTASITGGYVALVDALHKLKADKKLDRVPLVQGLGALSVGIVEGRAMVDLCADEDRAASVDMNVVVSHDGRFIEVQGTAEKQAFSRQEHDQMMDLVAGAMERVKEAQLNALAEEPGA
jgi:ribonuclease PH